MLEFPVVFAFAAGLISFLSPCILPLVPGFLSYLAGTSLKDASRKRRSIFFNSIFFVLGFSTVFSLLGVLLNTLLEAIAYDVQIWLARAGGALIVVFGLSLVGVLRIPLLDREHKFQMRGKFGSAYLTSFLFGSAFAAGWTPCVGAVLGGILGLAATAPGSAFWLLFSYSLGLGLPFLVVGLFTSRASGFINRFARYVSYVNKAFGIVLIVLGILVFTQLINRLATFDLLEILLR